MTEMGHEERFPQRRLRVCCGSRWAKGPRDSNDSSGSVSRRYRTGGRTGQTGRLEPTGEAGPMTAVLTIGAVQDHAANRGVELTPAVPPRSCERLEPVHRARTDCNRDRSLSDYPHMRANLTLLQ